jgi:hypothetical protein
MFRKVMKPFMVRSVNKNGKVSRMYADPQTCGGKTRKEAEVILKRFIELNPGKKFVIVEEKV